MSDSNRVRVSSGWETAFGVYSTPTLTTQRLTSESLHMEVSTISSNEIRSDRQTADIIRTGVSAAGELNWELSGVTYDQIFAQALMHNTFSAGYTYSSAGTDTSALISFDATDMSVNISSGTFAAAFVAKVWVIITGTTNGLNDGIYRIQARGGSNNKLQLVGKAVVTQSAGPSVTIRTDGAVLNGTNLQSQVFEKYFEDLTTTYEILEGMCLDQLSLNLAVEQIATGSCTYLGKTARAATATVGGAYASATTTQVINSIDHITGIMEGVPVAGTSNLLLPLTEVQSFGFSLNNNLRTRLQIGSAGAISVGTGKLEITGNITCLLNNSTKQLMDKFYNFSNTSIGIGYRDSANKGGAWYFPQAKLTRAQRVAGGINQDVLVDLEFVAYYSGTDAEAARFTRFS